MSRIEFTAPVKIISEMNDRSHWRKRKRRFDDQRFVTRLTLTGSAKSPDWGYTNKPPYIVTLTRIGPRTLDDDNLAGGFKAVRDEIAAILNVDDGDRSAVTWRYEQRRGRAKEYAIHVRIESVYADQSTRGEVGE